MDRLWLERFARKERAYWHFQPDTLGAMLKAMHYGRFGVAGGGVSPGAIIGLLGGAAGVVIGELTLSFEATRVG